MHNTEDMLMYYKEAIQIHKKVESISYSTLADDLDKIARKYKLMNDLNESLNYYKAAVETRENHLPNDYSNLAGSLYGLASIYEKMGEYTNALEYYNRQMNIYTENLNYDPTHILHRKAEENIDRMRQLI
jgi:tetratricopeptide (TPR) repeat protein